MVEDFDTKFSQARNGYKTFRKTKSGELMIPVSDVDAPIFDGINNVIVYAKGTMETPIITRVLVIDEYDETTLSDIRRDLYEVEKRGIQQKTGGIFRQYNPFNFGNYVDAQRNLRERQEHNNQLGINRGAGSGTVAKTQSGVRSPFLKLTNSLTYNEAGVEKFRKESITKDVTSRYGNNPSYAFLRDASIISIPENEKKVKILRGILLKK